jgi:hypothetical protein
MYYVFQQLDEESKLFYKACETCEDVKKIMLFAEPPVVFTYDKSSDLIDIISPLYDMQECHKLVSLLNVA